MGFKKPTRIINLVFEDEYEGLEINAKAPSVKTIMKISKLQEESINAIPQLVDILIEHLIDWNMEEDDGSLTVLDKEALDLLDLSLLRGIVEAWATAVAGVSAPLVQDSDNGELSQVAWIPTETL